MAKIKIQNIGAITNVEMELNKVNVIMGEQSSGKSTIAKLISYCQWVEKRSLLDGEYNYDVWEQLIEFHRLHKNYFIPDSYFEYVSEFIEISYSGEKLEQKIIVKEKIKYEKTKNIYLPAERNFVSVIPNLGRYNETRDNIMELIYDWFSAKNNFTEEKPLSILNFDIDYFYQSEIDTLLLKKGNKKIPLNTGSSGLQSITPLIAIIEYLTQIFYTQKFSLSVKERETLNHILVKLTDGKWGTFALDENESDFIRRRENYCKTQFIIEEPEQNLFPSTQRDLIYYILEKLNSERKHSLLITTHSPYILYALNNCMMGGLVNSQLEEKEKEEFLSNKFLSEKSWLTPKYVSIWEIEDGKLRSIQDKDGIISENYFDKKMTELMDEYYLMLNYYKDEE
ncbi:MAG: ATP-binding protein [Prevotellaceae bacterium]|jgi:predicted ATPase|nr:ATP-binding protein [Prevotellaceae bacterium]